ncbi:hypothetical protein A4H97_30775 [Niastella yeongjuensis]|uniref:Uncharacterized protein n=2 Tax=Niastella yeongjuensis TaxID=354355 RepID=A0A1V9ENU3_9BACT|nr:hypothetical protein A4H97_30775 [Niastella yeongjuensis]
MHYKLFNVIIAFLNIQYPIKMNCKVFVLALLVLIGSSCKHKEDPINTPPPQETPQSTPPHPTPSKPQDPNHHESDNDDHDGHHDGHDDDDCDHDHDCHHHDCHHHGKKHHRLPPGQEKKLHGDKSAKNYAPGHRKDK